jgi:hypothetical protein
MAGIRQKVLGCLIIVAAATAAYLPVFFNEFAWDDEYLVLKNPPITKLSSIPGFFVQSWAGDVDYELGKAQNKPYFRPMALTSMTLDWAIGGADKLVFHTTNLAIHLVAACLLFLWLLRVFAGTAGAGPGGAAGGLTQRRVLIGAFVGALLWAVHPVSTEAVNLVSYRTTLLSGLFTFATLLLLTPGRRTDVGQAGGATGAGPLVAEHSGFLAIVGAMICFAAGLLSKEITLVIPGLLFVMDLLGGRLAWKSPKSSLHRIMSVYLPLGVVGIVWLVLRSQFTGEGVYTYFEGLTVGQSVLMFGRIFYLYIRLAIAPWPLCPFYDWGILGVPRSILEPDIAAGFLLLALIVAAMFGTMKKYPLMSGGLAFFLVALLPVSHIIPFFDAAGDRFMYVPVVGLIMAAVGAAFAIPADHRLAKPGMILVAIMVLAFAGLTAIRSNQWKSSESMLTVTVRDFPTSISANLGLGRLYLEKKTPHKAIEPFKTVIEMSPSLAIGHALLAVAQARSGDITSAKTTLRMAPLPDDNTHTPVELARMELLKYREIDLARRVGLLHP